MAWRQDVAGLQVVLPSVVGREPDQGGAGLGLERLGPAEANAGVRPCREDKRQTGADALVLSVATGQFGRVRGVEYCTRSLRHEEFLLHGLRVCPSFDSLPISPSSFSTHSRASRRTCASALAPAHTLCILWFAPFRPFSSSSSVLSCVPYSIHVPLAHCVDCHPAQSPCVPRVANVGKSSPLERADELKPHHGSWHCVRAPPPRRKCMYTPGRARVEWTGRRTGPPSPLPPLMGSAAGSPALDARVCPRRCACV